MEVFENRYLKGCKVIMEFVGLWPYQNKCRRRTSHCIFYLLHCSLLLPLIFKLFKDVRLEVLVENTISVLFLFICIFKYSISYMNAPRFIMLLTQITKDWEKVKDKKELEILSKFAEEGRLAVIIYIAYVFLAWAAFNLLPFSPPMLDIVYPPKNGSRPLMLPFYADYILFDQIEHHYEICIHAGIVYFFGTSLFAGVDSMYVATVKHACGLFAITCYRLETAAKSEINKNSYGTSSGRIVRQDLRKAVILHNETINCCSLLEDSFSICILMIQTLVACTLAVGAFYLTQIYNDLYKLIRITAFFLGSVLHLMYIHWVGQQIIDSSERVFNSAYFSNWYLAPVNAQKLTTIVMIRTLCPSQLTAGKMTSLSVATFGTVIKTSMSYFTVLLSVE